ncbi:hypothetical protein Btru_003148 [Bulinus truncatus]|nr:hypothetical protein Btru_003148 [Bulinus truncatus]
MANIYPANTICTEINNKYTILDVVPTHKKLRVPKRVLHFSDGILEEYSSDEEESAPAAPSINPKELAWAPWFLHYLTTVYQKSLSAADVCGGKLAWLFGITTPKYQYAIDEYKRMEKEQEQEQARNQKLYEESQGLSVVEVALQGTKHYSGETNAGMSPVNQ